MYPQMNVPAGVSFFPSAWPEQKSAEQYFDEALQLSALADQLGYSHVRVLEPYFRPYGFRPHGGMAPNPIVLLSAVAARTQRIRLVAGAVVPIFNHLFNHPIRIAGETRCSTPSRMAAWTSSSRRRSRRTSWRPCSAAW